MSEERVTTGSEPRRRWPEGFAPCSPLTDAEVAEAVDAARAEMLNEVYMSAEDSATVYGELSRQLQDELEVVEPDVSRAGHLSSKPVGEPGHDEQTERLNTGEAGDIAAEFMAAQQAWQPDPRTVKAVVEWLRDQDDGVGMGPNLHRNVAARITERFSSEGTDG